MVICVRPRQSKVGKMPRPATKVAKSHSPVKSKYRVASPADLFKTFHPSKRPNLVRFQCTIAVLLTGAAAIPEHGLIAACKANEFNRLASANGTRKEVTETLCDAEYRKVSAKQRPLSDSGSDILQVDGNDSPPPYKRKKSTKDRRDKKPNMASAADKEKEAYEPLALTSPRFSQYVAAVVEAVSDEVLWKDGQDDESDFEPAEMLKVGLYARMKRGCLRIALFIPGIGGQPSCKDGRGDSTPLLQRSLPAVAPSPLR